MALNFYHDFMFSELFFLEQWRLLQAGWMHFIYTFSPFLMVITNSFNMFNVPIFLPPTSVVNVIELVPSVCLCVWVCESYVVHHLVSTGLHCAPPTCVMHHQHVSYMCAPWCTRGPFVGVGPNIVQCAVSVSVCQHSHNWSKLHSGVVFVILKTTWKHLSIDAPPTTHVVKFLRPNPVGTQHCLNVS